MKLTKRKQAYFSHCLKDYKGDALEGPLSKLAASLDNDYPARSLVVDTTPDSCIVVNGHIILYALRQVQGPT